VERAEYEAQLMMRRYLACDPDNALVRVELERAYNELLVEVARAQDALEAERLAHSPETEDEVLARVEGLERDFRAVCHMLPEVADVVVNPHGAPYPGFASLQLYHSIMVTLCRHHKPGKICSEFVGVIFVFLKDVKV
jgi:hypothetical protein